MQRIQQYWHDQAAAEYASAAITAQFSHWLLLVGASPDLVRQCLAIVDDEMVHAELCHAVLMASQSTRVLNLENQQMVLEQPYNDQRKNLLHALLNFYCLGETAAVPLFAAMRKHAQQAEVVQTYERILQDEPRHSSFGWLTLAWVDEVWPETREWLQEMLPQALRLKQQQYGQAVPHNPPLSVEERAWGMLPAEEYRHLLEGTILNLYAKHLKHYDVDVMAVWQDIQPSSTP